MRFTSHEFRTPDRIRSRLPVSAVGNAERPASRKTFACFDPFKGPSSFLYAWARLSGITLTGHALSGTASLVFGNEKYPYGSFVVVNGILVANIAEPLYGQNGALMFIAHASRGRIGQGAYENIEGGSNFDFGSLAFGVKNDC
jgi:hypothetical protein